MGLDCSPPMPNTLICQINAVIMQLKLAKTLNLPLILHCRAEDDSDPSIGPQVDLILQNLLREHNVTHMPIHLHCYKRNLKIAKSWIALCPNLKIGFTPNISNPDVVKNVPLSKVLIETDAPHFPPSLIPRPSLPWYAKSTAEEISQILNLPLSEILFKTYQNAKTLYSKLTI